jgi:hypothetical protein
MLTRLRSVSSVALLLTGSFFGLQGCVGATTDSTPVEDVNPSRSDALTMPVCGAVLGSFDGTEAHSNAGDTGTGDSCDGSGTYGLQYQCVELVMRHFKTHWNLSWSGNAKDLLVNAPKASVVVYSNGDGAHPPVPGDMIVWPNGAYGHVALVTAVHVNGIDVLEQNVKGNGKATLSWDGAHIGARWTMWTPVGWAHAKANGSPPIDNGTGGGGGGGTTSTSATTGSGGGPTWDCAKSAYNGNQYWTCSGGNAYRCDSNGVAEEQTCQDGCQSNQVGTDDTCKMVAPPPPPVSWDCAKSAYNGNQYWTCSGGNAYRCQNGVAEETVCANGCQSNPVGTNDTCTSSAPPVSWDCAKSAYNGNQYWTCSGGNIYRCQSGVPEEQMCGAGCQSNPVGTNDICK